MKDNAPLSGRADYYTQAQSWSQDVQDSLRASRSRAYIVAGAAVLIAVLEALALVLLMPLKTVVPYTITVDRQTGYVEAAQGLRPGPLSQDVAVTQAFLVQYVLARETFDPVDLQENYRKVATWTSGQARDDYIGQMQRSNPQSPENMIPSGTTLHIVIKSVSLLSRTSALVRFDAESITGGAAPTQRQPYTAVIGFRYTGAPMKMEDRFLNPLGFEVTSYRKDAETTAPVPETGTAP